MDQPEGAAAVPATMWRAIVARDPSWDGTFFYGVLTTGIFCFPSCPSRPPRREHVRLFATGAEALGAGFRPCRRCRPDLPGGRHQQEAEWVERIKALVEAQPEAAGSGKLAAAVGCSPQHLRRLFRKVTGRTLHDYIRSCRVRRAAELLRESRAGILDIAAAVGYASTSAFYTAFRQVFSVSPGSFRQEVGRPVDP